MKTVADYIRRLKEFPEDWPVQVATQAGGGIAIEHREIKGEPVVAVFGSNGGCFGEVPLTEEYYNAQSKLFLSMLLDGYKYTSVHGDHRLYNLCLGTSYGRHFDRRIIERMVAESTLSSSAVDLDRVRKCDT